MGFSKNTQATRSTLMSVDSTLSENITAAQNYIPIASTTNFSTAIVAEIETTNEVVSFTDISENLVTYSEDFTNAAWNKSGGTTTADVITAPDGTTTGNKLTSTTTSSTYFSMTPSGSTATQPYAVSVYAKAGDSDSLRIANVTSGSTAGWFDLTNGTIGTQNDTLGDGITSTITAVGDGWYRCTRSFPITEVAGATTFLFGNNSADGATSAPGSNKFIYVWGVQVENGTTVTTYLPTTSAQLEGLTGVTRGVNGTTATLATSGDAIQQLPYALSDLNMPTRLKAISVSSDGTGAGRFTLCDKIGTTLLDIDIPDDNLYELDFGDDRGIIFPNGIYVSNSDNITAYTLFTDKHSGTGLS